MKCEKPVDTSGKRLLVNTFISVSNSEEVTYKVSVTWLRIIQEGLGGHREDVLFQGSRSNNTG